MDSRTEINSMQIPINLLYVIKNMQINYNIQTIHQKCKKKYSNFYSWIHVCDSSDTTKAGIEEFPKGSPNFILHN